MNTRIMCMQNKRIGVGVSSISMLSKEILCFAGMLYSVWVCILVCICATARMSHLKAKVLCSCSNETTNLI